LRHCNNEAVSVYESVGVDLPTLLRGAADQLDELGRGYAYPDVHYNIEDDTFRLTLYVHE
jgi:hypothetical protein